MPAVNASRVWTRALIVAGLTGMALAATPPALARVPQTGGAEEETVAPPRPGKADDSAPTLMTYLVALVLFAAAVGVNLIPSKRGHQD